VPLAAPSTARPALVALAGRPQDQALDRMEVTEMTGSRRAAQVLELAVLTFVLGTIVMGAWIAGLILGVVDSHQVDDTMTLLLVLGPQGFTLGVGIAAVVSLRRTGPWGPFLGRLWAVLETIFALLAASRFLVLA
jgi:hypothetical protein